MRYHGVFAPNSKLRARVVALRGETDERARQAREVPEASRPPSPAPGRRAAPAPSASRPEQPCPAEPPGRTRARTRVPWAELLQKVFAVDVLACPRCAGRLEVIAFITQPEVAKQILDHLGLASQGPPVRKAAATASDQAEPIPEYDDVDPVYEE